MISYLSVHIISPLRMLESFDISENRLKTLTVMMFDNSTSLKFLFIDGNELGFLLPPHLYGLRRLRELNLSRNKLTVVTFGAFLNMQKLEILNLSHNRIQAITSQAFEGLSSLREIYLDHNDLVWGLLDESFSGTTSLSKL